MSLSRSPAPRRRWTARSELPAGAIRPGRRAGTERTPAAAPASNASATDRGCWPRVLRFRRLQTGVRTAVQCRAGGRAGGRAGINALRGYRDPGRRLRPRAGARAAPGGQPANAVSAQVPHRGEGGDNELARDAFRSYCPASSGPRNAVVGAEPCVPGKRSRPCSAYCGLWRWWPLQASGPIPGAPRTGRPAHLLGRC